MKSRTQSEISNGSTPSKPLENMCFPSFLDSEVLELLVPKGLMLSPEYTVRAPLDFESWLLSVTSGFSVPETNGPRKESLYWQE